MSSPSDNEKSKHTDDEESLSDKESFQDEKNVAKKDRKKKRKSKELLRSPAKVENLKSSPGTSKQRSSNLIVGDSDSSSGEKHVGVVGDNIKHLNLNEGDKLKDSKQKDGLKSTEVEAGIVASPQSQQDPIAESPLRNNNQIVQQPPAIEQGSLIHEYRIVDKHLKTRATASSSYGVHGEVPYNSLNEPVDSLELNADLHELPSTSVACRRKTFAQKADDTLDDVSEIVSDFPDIPSDSSLGQVSNQSGRRPSQETSSDVKAEGLSESLESESKLAAQKSKNVHKLRDGTDKDSKDHGSEKNVDDQLIAEDVHVQEHKSNDEDRGSGSKRVVEPHGSNGKSNTQRTSEKNGNENEKQEFDSQHCGKEKYGQASVVNQDVSIEQHQGLVEQGSASEEVVHQDVEEEMEEQNGSVQENPSDNEASESNPADSIEIEQVDMDEESCEIDQLDNPELVDEQENSSEQGGLNAESEQGSSNDYQNFARGQYVGFPIDSTTTDSGIENSLACFGGNYYVPDNSESNEGSALGSSGAAGYQNLQNWVERGAAASPLSQSNEGVPGPSNTTEQGGPCTSYSSILSKRILKVAILETIEDVPMECAEHFAESTSEGSILQVIPDSELKCEEAIQRLDSSGTNLGEENENLNLVSGSARHPSNAKLSEKTSSGAKIEESNPDEIDEENNSLHSEEMAANDNQKSSLDPNTSQRLVKGDSDQQSSSSQGQSREDSLADMDDAIDSNDSLSKDAEPQQTAANLLQTLGVPGVSLGKDSGSKPHGGKRRAKKPGDNNSPFKKRKDNAVTCGQQARAAKESSRRRKPDSDDDSSKDGRHFKG